MKKILLVLLGILLLSSVYANPSITTNETINVGTEIFTIHIVTNETVAFNYTITSDSVLIASGSLGSNDTELSLNIAQLEGNTLYNWQVDLKSLGKTTSVYNSVTTDDYILNNPITRSLLNFVSLIFFASILMLAYGLSKSFKDFIAYSVIGLILYIVVISILVL